MINFSGKHQTRELFLQWESSTVELNTKRPRLMMNVSGSRYWCIYLFCFWQRSTCSVIYYKTFTFTTILLSFCFEQSCIAKELLMRTNNSRECPSSASLYGIITLRGRCCISQCTMYTMHTRAFSDLLVALVSYSIITLWKSH